MMAPKAVRFKPTSKMGVLFGKVTGARPGRAPDSVCDRCPGALKGQRIMGMIVIRNFHAEGDDWVGGTFVDPENGKEYKGKMWAIGNDKLGMQQGLSASR